MTYTRLHNLHQITHPLTDHTICTRTHKIRSIIKQPLLNHIIRNRSHSLYQTKQSAENHIIRTRPDHMCRRQEKKTSGNEHFIKRHSTCLKLTEILNLKPTEFCTGTISACLQAVNCVILREK